jgi:hypothetical protein
MHTVRISCAPDEQVIPDPDRVFDALLPEAASLVWSISDAEEFTSKLGSSRLDVDQLKADVEGNPQGLVMEWSELRALLDDVLQVIDGTFVACRDRDLIPSRSPFHEELVGRANMVVSAIDSSYWLVTASDHVVQRLIDLFPGTETV